MKSAICILTFVVVLQLLYGCEGQRQLVLTGQLTSHSTCKSNVKSTFKTFETADTLSCVEYSFDEVTNKLTLKHVNAAFNCCPGNLYSKIKLSGDTIIIEEFESTAECNCNCIYDLDFEITGVVTGAYQVKLIEPYATGKAQLDFKMDLTKESVGSFCVTRKQYPWGM